MSSIMFIDDKDNVYEEMKANFEKRGVKVFPEANFPTSVYNDDTGDILFSNVWKILENNPVKCIMFDLFLNPKEIYGNNVVSFISVNVMNRIQYKLKSSNMDGVLICLVTSADKSDAQLDDIPGMDQNWQRCNKEEFYEDNSYYDFIIDKFKLK